MSEPGHTTGAEPALLLVADDDKDARELYASMLRGAGYRVIEATNGRDAIDLVVSHHPAAVLMDRVMPLSDGIDATRRLKADPATEPVPVVALTADTRQATVLAALEAGCDAFLAKPCSPEALLDTVRRVLRDAERRATTTSRRKNGER